jgi:deazaflavin-dependent oxidoreductase (nitroreductase family)
VRLYRASWGLIGGRVDGLDILLLTTLGKKTGISRTVPLPYFRDGSRYLLVASFGGGEKNPAWFHNLKATPHVEIQVGRKRMKAQALTAEGAERERLWGQITRDFPRYLNYQAMTERQIPLVVLTPV